MKKLLYLLLISAPIFSMQQPINKNQTLMNDKKLPLDTKKVVTTTLTTGKPLSALDFGIVAVGSILCPFPTAAFYIGTATVIATKVIINNTLDNNNNKK